MPGKRPQLFLDKIHPSGAGITGLPGAQLVPVAAIEPNPDQPRKGELVVEDLAASIVEHGLLQPILVTPAHAGTHTCIAGHRRLAAFKWLLANHEEPARWVEIPAIVRDTGAGDRLVLALLENLSRQNLSDAEIITGLRVLHDLRQWSQAEIARKLGVSRAWINQYFRVASDSQVSEHVQTETIPVAKAYWIVLAKSPDARQQALAAALSKAPQRTVRLLAAGGAISQPWEQGRPEGQAAYSNCTPEAAGGAAGQVVGRDGGASWVRIGPDGQELDRHGAPEAATGAAHGEAEGTAQPAGDSKQPDQREWSGYRQVNTASPEAGVRDLAELADELGLSSRLGDLQLTRLFREALASGSDTVSTAALVRLIRADLRRLEAQIRSVAR